MSKRKISGNEKLTTVLRYLDGNISQGQIACKLNVSLASVQQWIFNYESMGADVFSIKGNKKYPKELKMQAVEDYLAGLGSQIDVCKKYGIRSKSKLQRWIKQCNGYDEN